MQFAYQHREYCRRLVLVNSGGLGNEVGVMLRMLSAPGAELLLPVYTSTTRIGGKLKILMRRSAPPKPRADSHEYSFLADRPGRQAFLRTLRSVVDLRGQSVCALGRLPVLLADLPTLIVAGEQDRVIPPSHAEAAHAVLSASTLEILDGVGHHPQVECPARLSRLIDEFVSGNAAEPQSIFNMPRLSPVNSRSA
jgi:pimeloyl-ACP methyl ester carboxylesterase